MPTSARRMLCAVLFVLVSRATPQDSPSYNVAFQLTEEPRNPRLVAMGSAGTATGDRGSYYYNPAMSALAPPRYLGFEYGRLFSEVGLSTVEGGVQLREWFFSLAIPVTTLEGIIPATEQKRAEYARFSWQSTLAALGAGYRFGNAALAVCLYGMQERIGTDRARGVSVSAGLVYEPLPGRLTLGAAGFYPAFLTATTAMRDSESSLGDGYNLAQLARAGVGWSDTIAEIPWSASLDVVYNYDRGSVHVPLGIELLPFDFLAVRAGKRIGHDTDRFSFGFGLMLSTLRFDNSFVISRFVQETELKWLLGLTWSLFETP